MQGREFCEFAVTDDNLRIDAGKFLFDFHSWTVLLAMATAQFRKESPGFIEKKLSIAQK
jgi:hypothetical protein